MPVNVTEHVVVGTLSPELDSVERGLERSCKLRVRCGKGRCGRRREAAVTEQESQRVWVDRDLARLEISGRREQRQLVSVLVGPAEGSGHLTCLEHTSGLAAPAVFGCHHAPQVLAAAERRGAVWRAHP